jgi:hypothetical protein
MTDAQHKKLEPGDIVVLTELPPGLLDDLPLEDQRAISETVGKPIVFNEYDEHGRLELQFTSGDGHIHFIWVEPKFIKLVTRS